MRESAQAGLRLTHDTHYDARNWELQWWAGNTLIRLDFQPQDEASLKVRVTRYRDTFPMLGRLLNLAHRVLPVFPYVARRKSEPLTIAHLPIHEPELLAILLKGGAVGS